MSTFRTLITGYPINFISNYILNVFLLSLPIFIHFCRYTMLCMNMNWNLRLLWLNLIENAIQFTLHNIIANIMKVQSTIGDFSNKYEQPYIGAMQFHFTYNIIHKRRFVFNISLRNIIYQNKFTLIWRWYAISFAWVMILSSSNVTDSKFLKLILDVKQFCFESLKCYFWENQIVIIK